MQSALNFLKWYGVEFYQSFFSFSAIGLFFFFVINILIFSFLYSYFYKTTIMKSFQLSFKPVFYSLLITIIVNSFLGMSAGRFLHEQIEIELPTIPLFTYLVQSILLTIGALLLIKIKNKYLSWLFAIILLIVTLGTSTTFLSQRGLLMVAIMLSLTYMHMKSYLVLNANIFHIGTIFIIFVDWLFFALIQVLALRLFPACYKELKISYKQLFGLILLSNFIITVVITIGFIFSKYH